MTIEHEAIGCRPVTMPIEARELGPGGGKPRQAAFAAGRGVIRDVA